MRPAPSDPPAALVRALGVRGLAASIFNVTVGGGIFVLPAVVAGQLGAAAPLAYLVCALAMGLIVLCFAEAGSRVSLTGGPYAYVETVFGPLAGFLAGVLLWMLGSFAAAGVAVALAGAVGALAPPLATGWGRALVLAGVLGALAWVNVRGVRQGARLVEWVTVAKLAPLLLFVGVGVFFVSPQALVPPAPPAPGSLARTALVLLFAFCGVESALVPSGEVKDPARTVPRALALAMGAVTLLYLGVQLVAQGVLGAALAHETATPLADAAGRAVGPAGGALLLAGAGVSMFGYLSGMTLAVPRALFAFGRDGVLPRAFARVHPRFHTPHVAIVAQTLVVFALAASGTFAELAILANVSVLLLYLLCCLAAWALRRRDVRSGGVPFRVPFGGVVPIAASLLIAVWLAASVTAREWAVTGALVAAGAALFLARRRSLTRAGRDAEAATPPSAP